MSQEEIGELIKADKGTYREKGIGLLEIAEAINNLALAKLNN